MARIRLSVVSMFVMLQCASMCVAADVATPPQAPHPPSAFWSGAITLIGIGVLRTVRRQWVLLRS
jgi:hypothetical protein